jgi:hypothetical protein
MLSSIFGYPKSTEHPHKLPDLIVKEHPEIFFRERPPIINPADDRVKDFLNFFHPAGDVRSVGERVFYSPPTRCQQLIFWTFRTPQKFPRALRKYPWRRAHYTSMLYAVNSLLKRIFSGEFGGRKTAPPAPSNQGGAGKSTLADLQDRDRPALQQQPQVLHPLAVEADRALFDHVPGFRSALHQPGVLQ